MFLSHQKISLFILFSLLLFSFSWAKSSSVDSLKTVMTALETLHKTGKLDSNGKLNLGRVYFYLAVEDKDILEKGEKYFKLMGNERKAESTAYLAALEAIRAKNALWPMDKWTIANSALSKMDQVVEANPDNIEVRFIRASTCYYLPFFFNRKDQVKSDFVILAQLIPVGYSNYPAHLIRNISSFILKSNYLPEKNAESLRKFLWG
jgi:hypothetical protein